MNDIDTILIKETKKQIYERERENQMVGDNIRDQSFKRFALFLYI